GPGVAWFDVDSDGYEDLLIPSGKGGIFSLFKNDRRGGFTRWADAARKDPASDDQTAALGCTLSPNKRSLLVALSKYESLDTNAPAFQRFDFSGTKGPRDISSPQPG